MEKYIKSSLDEIELSHQSIEQKLVRQLRSILRLYWLENANVLCSRFGMLKYNIQENSLKLLYFLLDKDNEMFMKILTYVLSGKNINIIHSEEHKKMYHAKRWKFLTDTESYFKEKISEYSQEYWISSDISDYVFTFDDIIFDFVHKKLEIWIFRWDKALDISIQTEINETNLYKKTPTAIKLLYAILMRVKKNKIINIKEDTYKKDIWVFCSILWRSNRWFDVFDYITNVNALLKTSLSWYSLERIKKLDEYMLKRDE